MSITKQKFTGQKAGSKGGIRMKRTILITEPVNQKGIDLLKEQGYDVRMGSGPQEDTLI